MLEMFDDIDAILVELMDNKIDYDFYIRDKKEKSLQFDIRFFPKFITDRYFPYLEFYGRDGKLKPYIKDALLTLDNYLKIKLMRVRVHSRFTDEGMMLTIPEFVEIEGKKATTIHIKSSAAYLLLKDKYKKAELDDIKKLFSAGIPVYRYKTNDPKLTRILVTLNNLQFLKHKLKELSELRCEYCDKGPLVIYDIFPNELDNLIGNPHHRLNTKFNPTDGATCDHKNPQFLGGDKFDYDNLAVCCNSCNQRKGSMPYDLWMHKIKKTR